MPGLTALAVWNLRGTRQTARRPELPLTAVNSLFVTIGISIIVHMIGVAAVGLVIGAAQEWNLTRLPELPVPHNPYPVAVNLLVARMDDADGRDLFSFLCLIVIECLVTARLLSSAGVSLAFEGHDLRGVGWADKHFLQPLRHDYTPIGFVMLQATDEGRGTGFSGPIDELRLNSEGEVKSITLGRPQRFIYELTAKAEAPSTAPPDLKIHDEKWVGGVVHLTADRIDNIVIHNEQDETLAAVEQTGLKTPKPRTKASANAAAAADAATVKAAAVAEVPPGPTAAGSRARPVSRKKPAPPAKSAEAKR